MNSTKIESQHNNRNGAILVPTSPLGNTTNKAYEKALAYGILTQVILVISFIIIRLSNFHQVLIMHPWMTLLGFSCIHIYCNYLFYRKFVIPTCDKNTNEYILEDSEQRQQDEQPEVVEPSSVGKIYARLILIFFLFCNIVSSYSYTTIFTFYVFLLMTCSNQFLHDIHRLY